MQFQSTLPRRERPGCRIFLKSYLDISIHAPTKGATNDYSKSSYSNSISIHALTKGATASWQFHLLRKIISIHAPTKGATAASTSDIYHEIISIHAPTKGATQATQNAIGYVQFQSTLPRRERQCHPRYDKIHNIISIHAPTKGATSSVALWTIRTMYFNPRSHEGSDVTSPSAQLFLLYFNPRSHEGSDDSLYGIFQSRPQFQSTLPRRERHSWKTFLMVSFPFQSTLPRRERLVLLC